MDVAPVTAFETGTNTWRRLPPGPPAARAAASIKPTPLYLNAGEGELRRRRQPAMRLTTNTFPIRQNLFRFAPARTSPTGYTEELSWWRWLVDDQREASGRTDVLTLRFRHADLADEDQRPADREYDRVDQRYRLRLGRKGDRRLSGRSRGTAGHGRLSTDGLGRHFPRPLSRKLRNAKADRGRTSRCYTALSCRRPITSSCPATG